MVSKRQGIVKILVAPKRCGKICGFLYYSSIISKKKDIRMQCHSFLSKIITLPLSKSHLENFLVKNSYPQSCCTAKSIKTFFCGFIQLNMLNNMSHPFKDSFFGNVNIIQQVILIFQFALMDLCNSFIYYFK